MLRNTLSKKLSKCNIFLQKKKTFFSIRLGYLFWSPLLRNEGISLESVLLEVCSRGHLGTYKRKFVGPTLDLLTRRLWVWGPGA